MVGVTVYGYDLQLWQKRRKKVIEKATTIHLFCSNHDGLGRATLSDRVLKIIIFYPIF